MTQERQERTSQQHAPQTCELFKPFVGSSPKVMAEIQNKVQPPGWKFKKRRSNNRKISKQTLNLSASNTVSGAASIEELARALKNDVDLIYEWVYSNIEFYPIWGSHKSVLGTILDGYGNSFEQAAVMVALLTQSGYTAKFVFGTIQLSKAEIENWLGTDDNTVKTTSYNILQAGGIPSENFLDGSGNLDYVTLDHVYVRVNIGGTDFVFDPSLKSYSYKTGIDLGAAINFNETTLISQAESGATVATDYIQNLNRANIRNKFKEYGTNLLDWINAYKFDASMDDIVGGRTILPLSTSPVRETVHPKQVAGFPTFDTTSIPNFYRATYKVAEPVSGIDYTFYTDAIYGQRLTISFNSSVQPELRLDGALLQTGSALTENFFYTLNFTLDHPFFWGGDQTWSQSMQASGVYFLAGCYGPTSQAMVDYHKQALQANIAAGANDSSEEVIGESLAVMWFSHQSQYHAIANIADWIGGTTHFLFNVCGITGKNAYNQGPYFDIQGYLLGTRTRRGIVSDSEKVYPISFLFNNAFEAGVMQQRFPVTGVNTQRMLDTGNTAGQKIFDATAANWTTGSAIRSQLTNFNSATLSQMDSQITAGARLIVHKDGATAVGNFTGGGWHQVNGAAIGGWLSGHVLGGASSEPISDPDINQGTSTTPDTSVIEPGNEPVGGDPVSLFSGTCLVSTPDISVGTGDFPYELTFWRNYSSASNYSDGVLGRGWSHGFESSVNVLSNGFRGLGEFSPKEAAAAIALTYVSLQLSLYSTSTTTSLTKLLIASLSNLWLMDELTNNSVSIAADSKNQTFMRMVDGSFGAPMGSADLLSKNLDGSYTLKSPQELQWSFSPNGKIQSFSTPAGMSVSYTYDVDGKLLSVTNGLGRTLTLNYTGSRLSSVSDGNGRSVSFTIDSNGNLTSVTNALGKSSAFSYDTAGRLTQVFGAVNPTSPQFTNEYDELGRVKTQKNAFNQESSYYIAGFRSEEIDPAGNKRIHYFNRFGQLLKEVDALGNITSHEYDGLGRLCASTMPEGDRSEYVYDNKNNLLTRTKKAKPGSPLADVVLSSTYHSTFNLPITSDDGNGNTTTNTYDSLTGSLLKVEREAIGGLIPTRTYTYNSRGQVETVIDETGITYKATYDPTNGNLLTAIDDYGIGKLNLTRSFAYDAIGNCTSTTDARGNTRNSDYDAQRRLTQNTAPSPFFYATQLEYDDEGRVTSKKQQTGNVLNPWQVTSYTYSLSGKVLSLTDPSDNTTYFEYDLADRQFRRIDALDRVFETTFDELNRVVSTIEPNGQVREIKTFTPNGQIDSVKDARDNLTQYEYDGFDRLSKRIYSDTTFDQYTYDRADNLLSSRNRTGQTTINTFDVLNRLSTSTPSGLATRTMTYDLAGRKTMVSTPVVFGDPTTGDYQFSYDSAGRLIQQLTPEGQTITYNLDQNGNKVKLVYPDGYFVDYSFDELNRMIDVTLNGSSTPSAIFEYDALSKRSKLTFDNGTTTSYQYEIDNDLRGISHTFSGESVDFHYQFDAVRDLQDQSVSDSRYMWVPTVDNTDLYETANALNQYPSVSGSAYSYNQNGCLTADGLWTYTYDSLNRLTNAASTSASTSYSYDPLDRQAESSSGSNVTRFVYDGLRRLVEYDAAGNLTSRFIYGASLDELLIKLDSTEDRTYQHLDRLGSAVAVTDSVGSVVNRAAYGPFGESPTNLTPIGYTGQWFDSDTGLYYFKARMYSPKLGRFLQPDPAGSADGLNLYAYVSNSPLRYTDPLGLSSSSADSWSDNSSLDAGMGLGLGSPVIWEGSRVHVQDPVNQGEMITFDTMTDFVAYTYVRVYGRNIYLLAAKLQELHFKRKVTGAINIAEDFISIGVSGRPPNIKEIIEGAKEFERVGIRFFQLIKNTSKFRVTNYVTSMHDAETVAGIMVEFKDWVHVKINPQLRSEAANAMARGVPLELIVSPRTQKIDSSVFELIYSTGGHVRMFDPISGVHKLVFPR